MNPTRHGILVAIVTLFAAAHAAGDLVEADDSRYGPQSLTIDTRTGLAWLDVSLSRGHSYLAVQAATQPGGAFDGFRHATVEEVGSLFDSAGLGRGVFFPVDSRFQAAGSLLSLVGATRYDDGYPSAYAISGTLAVSGGQSSALVPFIRYGYPSSPLPDRILGYEISLEGFNYGLNTQAPTVGNWLVVVPEPATTWLAIAGGIFLVVGRAKEWIRSLIKK